MKQETHGFAAGAAAVQLHDPSTDRCLRVVGLHAPFHLGVASGVAVMLAATLIFVIVFPFAPGRGLLRWAR